MTFRASQLLEEAGGSWRHVSKIASRSLPVDQEPCRGRIVAHSGAPDAIRPRQPAGADSAPADSPACPTTRSAGHRAGTPTRQIPGDPGRRTAPGPVDHHPQVTPAHRTARAGNERNPEPGDIQPGLHRFPRRRIGHGRVQPVAPALDELPDRHLDTENDPERGSMTEHSPAVRQRHIPGQGGLSRHRPARRSRRLPAADCGVEVVGPAIAGPRVTLAADTGRTAGAGSAPPVACARRPPRLLCLPAISHG